MTKVVTRAQAITLGLKRYFTGKPCPHGHTADRYLNGTCVACIAEREKQWRSANPEKVLAKGNRWRANNRERDRANGRAWRARNLEKERAKDRERIAANREAHNAKGRAWRAANLQRNREIAAKSNAKHREKRNARTKAWLDANPDRRAAGQALYKARKLRAAPSWLTAEHLAMINEIYKTAYERGASVDHLVPLAGCIDCGAHGLHVPWNLVIVPLSDNKAKYARCAGCWSGINAARPATGWW